ncbi:hypothetical protein D6D01_07299 [Aureobasidium pullulans]|uniref:Uncharacterized protein n=1 Tax=Aureobasidium pullulans TaxID=5580 RepID=A0A4V4JTQ5_AURPU|nr:hypothetical protein D6D01_07299 [Aureobasidium pullulans]
MFFTSDQLSADPELRPITWSSPQVYQSERHYLYTQLAEALHISASSSSAANSATTSTSDISNASSNVLSPKSSKSDLVSSTSKRDSIISCSADKIITLASKKSASSLMNACSRKLISPFLPSSPCSAQVQKFKPVTFNSPQTSVFRFDTAGPSAASTSASAASTSASTSTSITTTATTPIKASPTKVDSVMGSPIKFSSPSLFKRNNNNNKIISCGAAGKIIKSCAMVKESDIFNYFKGLGRKDDCGENCGVGTNKQDIIHNTKNEDNNIHDSEEKSENGKRSSCEKAEEADNNTKQTAHAKHTDNAKAGETPLPINPDMNEKGILYIEYLGLAVVAAGEPKSMEEQYLFVKQQIQKSRDMGFEVRGYDVMV